MGFGAEAAVGIAVAIGWRQKWRHVAAECLVSLDAQSVSLHRGAVNDAPMHHRSFSVKPLAEMFDPETIATSEKCSDHFGRSANDSRKTLTNAKTSGCIGTNQIDQQTTELIRRELATAKDACQRRFTLTGNS